MSSKPKAHWKPLLKAFKREVDARSDEVDPENSEDWSSLTLGWAIAKGLAPDDAIKFARYVSYMA